MLSFVCIGAQKAGTSWVHAQLARSPEIGFPRGKEVHYWDWVQRGKRPLNLIRYVEPFARDADSPRLLGDMTPAYATVRPEYVHLHAQMYPEAPLFMLLRDPVERAWSAARMDWAAEHPQASMTPDPAWLAAYLRDPEVLAKGDYARSLRTWGAYFPSGRLRAFMYADIARRPRPLLRDICAHIGADDAFVDDITDAALMERVRPGPRSAPCPPAMAAELRAWYLPRMRALEDLLGQALPDWQAAT